MLNWYVFKTISGKESQAVSLLERRIEPALWNTCRILRKMKVFRSKGRLHLLEDTMFPGYVLVQTEVPDQLSRALEQSGKFPQPLTQPFSSRQMVLLDKRDLAFLQSVCGKDLREPMGVTDIFLGNDKQIVRADGVLEPYLDRLVKLNLHKRFAVVEVELWGRCQPVLFGLRLEQDRGNKAG